MLSRARALTRALPRALTSRARHAPTRVLVAGAVGVAGLAAVPVASDLADEDDTPDATLEAAPIESFEGDHGLDRWYSAEEAEELAPDVETIRVTPADAEDPEPEVQTVSQEQESEQEQQEQQAAPAERSRWDRLADCESGEWVDGGASFVEGSARWDYGIDFAHEGYEQFEGGLNFAAGTWDAFRDPDMPDHAGNATREQQIVVAERVLAEQGWGAWPRCSEMVGLR
jgi:hypothetical protein